MKTKKSLIGAASAVGAAVLLSTIGFAMPAQAAEACWTGEYGPQCRDYGPGATGAGRVNAMDHPTFTGVLKAGQTLTSNVGEWENAATFKHQWLRDGVVIPGAVGKTYKLTAADTGKSITLRVTGSNKGFKDGVQTTLASPKVAATNTAKYTARPAITGEAPIVWGTPRVGATLEVGNLGTWSPGFMIVKLQWQANGVDIKGATANEYRLQPGDVGKKVTLKVTGSWPGSASVSKSNTATAAVAAGFIQMESPWMMGTFKVGSTVTAKTGAAYANGSAVSYKYQWLRDGTPIAGATAASYKLTAADKGKGITVKVTASAAGYAPRALLNDGGPSRVA